MSENIIPEKIQAVVSDVAEKLADVAEVIADKTEEVVEAISDKAEEIIDAVQDKAKDIAEAAQDKAEDFTSLGDKTLAELSELFGKLRESADKMARSKEAEAIKSAFYKLLGRLKQESPSESSLSNPFEAVEQNFKAMYADYKKERAEFNKQQDEQKEANLIKKQAIIDELKTLVESSEDMSSQFPAFRELQNRWRDAGPVPTKSFRNINDSYQYYVEKFYDMVKISRDPRDLDFKKNLEAKIVFCETAEKLAANDNIVAAFNELQKLHDQWKEFGPVAKEFREDVWNRFKSATSVINKRYQTYFEGLKSQQQENLEKKTKLCERMEEIAAAEISSAAEWNSYSKEIEGIQAEWKTIGYATRKENQKVYDRFRAACDAFFTRKRNYYASMKDDMNVNLEKKLALIEQAEALKTSTEWKKASDQFIALQKQWKEIGVVPRKRSEQLWKRFRAACDEFFANRDANSGGSPADFYSNLKAKKKLLEEIAAYNGGDSESAAREFNDKWQAAGLVPFKDKDSIAAEYRQLMQEKFPSFRLSQRRGPGSRQSNAPRSPKDALIAKYNALQQDITTYENNIGFFSASKNAAPLIQQMQEKIESAKEELKQLELQIRKEGEEA